MVFLACTWTQTTFLLTIRFGLFKRRITLSTGEITIKRIAWFVLLTLIHWIAIYPVDSIIQPLNNWGLTSNCIITLIIWKWFFCRRQKLMEREEFTKSKASSSLLSDDSSDLAGVRYRPKTRETKSTYEVLLSFIQAAIGDQVTVYVLRM